MTLSVTILGCGGSGGVPLIGGDWGVCDPAEPRNRRLRPSILVGHPGGRLLVDSTPDLRQQLLDAGVGEVDAVVYTHAHADHVSGLDDLRIVNRRIRRVLPAYGAAGTLDEIARRFDYAFVKDDGPVGFWRPALLPLPVVPGSRFTAAGLEIETIVQDHGVMASLGLRIGRFAYSTDVVRLEAAALAALAGLDTWIVGCFQRRPHKTHAHVAQVLEWVALLRPRRTILTHMGPDLDWAWMRANLPPGVEAAYDGMRLEVEP
ncbi:MAG: MBL fold metallo-hydrolase [Alphaproteobacteria bacterium]|nr:MBL fold metallo-hydrolase [Alphaproteobacteria bacterium]